MLPAVVVVPVATATTVCLPSSLEEGGGRAGIELNIGSVFGLIVMVVDVVPSSRDVVVPVTAATTVYLPSSLEEDGGRAGIELNIGSVFGLILVMVVEIVPSTRDLCIKPRFVSRQR